jgi:hypothetical protein
MSDDIRFLKELQQELKTQDHDHQAAPRFWTVGDYEKIVTAEDYQDSYEIVLPASGFRSLSVEEFIAEIKEEDFDELSDEAKEKFEEAAEEFDGFYHASSLMEEWVKEYIDKDAYLVPVKEVHVVKSNTMFLTKAEAKEHIRQNHYHYSPRAHTYAMTAWRAPKVEKLLQILENFDWDSVEV